MNRIDILNGIDRGCESSGFFHKSYVPFELEQDTFKEGVESIRNYNPGFARVCGADMTRDPMIGRIGNDEVKIWNAGFSKIGSVTTSPFKIMEMDGGLGKETITERYLTDFEGNVISKFQDGDTRFEIGDRITTTLTAKDEEFFHGKAERLNMTYEEFKGDIIGEGMKNYAGRLDRQSGSESKYLESKISDLDDALSRYETTIEKIDIAATGLYQSLEKENVADKVKTLSREAYGIENLKAVYSYSIDRLKEERQDVTSYKDKIDSYLSDAKEQKFTLQEKFEIYLEKEKHAAGKQFFVHSLADRYEGVAEKFLEKKEPEIKDFIEKYNESHEEKLSIGEDKKIYNEYGISSDGRYDSDMANPEKFENGIPIRDDDKDGIQELKDSCAFRGFDEFKDFKEASYDRKVMFEKVEANVSGEIKEAITDNILRDAIDTVYIERGPKGIEKLYNESLEKFEDSKQAALDFADKIITAQEEIFDQKEKIESSESSRSSNVKTAEEKYKATVDYFGIFAKGGQNTYILAARAEMIKAYRDAGIDYRGRPVTKYDVFVAQYRVLDSDPISSFITKVVIDKLVLPEAERIEKEREKEAETEKAKEDRVAEVEEREGERKDPIDQFINDLAKDDLEKTEDDKVEKPEDDKAEKPETDKESFENSDQDLIERKEADPIETDHGEEDLDKDGQPEDEKEGTNEVENKEEPEVDLSDNEPEVDLGTDSEEKADYLENDDIYKTEDEQPPEAETEDSVEKEPGDLEESEKEEDPDIDSQDQKEEEIENAEEEDQKEDEIENTGDDADRPEDVEKEDVKEEEVQKEDIEESKNDQADVAESVESKEKIEDSKKEKDEDNEEAVTDDDVDRDSKEEQREDGESSLDNRDYENILNEYLDETGKNLGDILYDLSDDSGDIDKEKLVDAFSNILLEKEDGFTNESATGVVDFIVDMASTGGEYGFIGFIDGVMEAAVEKMGTQELSREDMIDFIKTYYDAIADSIDYKTEVGDFDRVQHSWDENEPDYSYIFEDILVQVDENTLEMTYTPLNEAAADRLEDMEDLVDVADSVEAAVHEGFERLFGEEIADKIDYIAEYLYVGLNEQLGRDEYDLEDGFRLVCDNISDVLGAIFSDYSSYSEDVLDVAQGASEFETYQDAFEHQHEQTPEEVGLDAIANDLLEKYPIAEAMPEFGKEEEMDIDEDLARQLVIESAEEDEALLNEPADLEYDLSQEEIDALNEDFVDWEE